MSALNVGIVGCGQISATYLSLAPVFRDFAITAVADLNAEAAQARAAEFGVTAMEVDALYTAPDIDIVLNLTVPAAHAAVSEAALAAGKHVYSEKPLARSMDEARALVAQALAANRLVGVAPDTFLGGAAQRARAALDAGRIGPVLGGSCHVMGRGPAPWHPSPGFFYAPGGGPAMDMGPYYVTLLVSLLGPVARVAAMTAIPRTAVPVGSGPLAGTDVPVTTPTRIDAVLGFDCGAQITFSASWDVQAHRHGHVELYGSDASLFLPDPNHFGGDVVLATTDGEHSVPVEDHPFDTANQIARANYRGAGLADLAAAIQSGAPPRCGADLGLHVLEVLTAMLEAGETGQTVPIISRCARPRALPAAAARDMLRAG